VTDGRENAAVQVQAAKVWVAEAIATWAVHRVLESGYTLVTGRVPPTARDRTVPFRRVVVWAALSAAAVAIADVAADRFVLRAESPESTAPTT